MCKSCISIELAPEFGWSIQNKNVFGPGSVIQGFVIVKNSNEDRHNVLTRAEKIRVLFSSNETIQAYTVSPGIVRSSNKSIFSVQKVIWDNKNLDITPMKSEYTFPFTVQLPMVQFPPSMDHPLYKTEYKLTAIVDMVESRNDVTESSLHSRIPILYMPFIETSLLKSPMIINTTTSDNEIKASLKFGNRDYVPGDYVEIELTLNSSCNDGKRNKQTSKNTTVILELQQTLKVLPFDDVPDQLAVVASASQRLSLELTTDTVSPSYNCVAGIGLFVPTDLPPSFQGKLTSVSYALHVRVQQKTALGGIWKRSSNISEIPVTVGTLGYGIRSSSLLKNYSIWSDTANSAAPRNQEGEEMPLPKFLQQVEYEEALPLYKASDLPSYSEATTPPPIADT